ncbi:hypothetical protein H0H93_013391, partial [Arthromyces matolae]
MPSSIAATITLYSPSLPQADVGFAPVSTSFSIQAIGTSTNGATTYVQKDVKSVFIDQHEIETTVTSNGAIILTLSTVTVTTTLPTPSTMLVTFAEDASNWAYHKDPAPTGSSLSDIQGVDEECTSDGNGNATCVVKAWEEENGSSTLMSTETETITLPHVPYYTLTVPDAASTAGSTKVNGAVPRGKLAYEAC